MNNQLVMERCVAHHWLIETSNGHTSKGVCARCGETKDFANSIPELGQAVGMGWGKPTKRRRSLSHIRDSSERGRQRSLGLRGL